MPFLAPVLPAILGAVAPTLIGGLIGGNKAAPAAAGAESAAQGQASMINMLMDAFKQIQPMQAGLAGQAAGMAGALPANDIMMFNMLQNLLPTLMPDVIRARGEERIRTPGERGISAKREELSRRGITGPLAERLAQPLEEQMYKDLAGYGSDVAEWEATQTMGKQGKVFEDMLRVLGFAGSQVGAALPNLGNPMTGAANLQTSLQGAAAGAAAPWQQLGSQVGGIIQDPLKDYFSKIFAPKPVVPTPGTGSAWLSQPPPVKW